MLSVEQALDAIEREIPPADACQVALQDSLGLNLAENVLCDADSPPFDKALMDGYAVRAQDGLPCGGELRLIGEVTAGREWSGSLGPGDAVRIMTGAPLPAGADCVVPFEQASETDTGRRIVVRDPALQAGRHLARRGEAARRGDITLKQGTLLGPPQLGAMAEAGRAMVQVIPRPSLGVLATGDELVPVGTVPGPGQIRNSNEIMLLAQARQAGAEARGLGIAADERTRLVAAVHAGLAADFLCLSGGVSKGTRDFVPAVLEELGVVPVFHGCDVKPGKPVWFGKWPGERSADARDHWIFGLPGNPVSSMVCFELFARTAIRKRMGSPHPRPLMLEGRLGAKHVSSDSRPTYFPVILTATSDGLNVEPIVWRGSFDLQSAARANGLVLFSSAREYAAGELVRVLPLAGFPSSSGTA